MEISLVIFFAFFAIGILLIMVVLFIKENNSRKSYKAIVRDLEERDNAFNATAALNAIVLETLDFKKAVQQIANAIPQFLGYETGVLALVDESKGILKRVSISETTGGKAALASLEIKFEDIDIKLTEKENYCIKALYENRPLYTTQLYDVLRPVVSIENAAKVQKVMGTKTTLIFPIYTKNNKPFGIFIVSMAKNYDQISEYEHQTIKNFVDGIRIVLKNATLYTSLASTTEQLKQANDRLIRLDKLKDEFVSLASHELRTPMSSIKSNLWMSLNGHGGSITDKQRVYLQRSYDATERLIRLVNDMLNVSRIDSGRITIEKQAVDLVPLVQQVFDEVMPHADDVGVSLTMQKIPLPQVLADPDKVKEVVFNLLGNALKFTPKGGSVTVSFVHHGDIVETIISDTGTGIEQEDIPKLFEKFGLVSGSYISDRSIQGTGLGLYICRAIVNLHNGKIWITSEGRGKGTQVTFSLPVFHEGDVAVTSSPDKKQIGLVHTDF